MKRRAVTSLSKVIGFFILIPLMEKFLKSFRLLKSCPPELRTKLVWNPDPLTPSNNPWLVTFAFSKRLIEARGMEVVYG